MFVTIVQTPDGMALVAVMYVLTAEVEQVRVKTVLTVAREVAAVAMVLLEAVVDATVTPHLKQYFLQQGQQGKQ